MDRVALLALAALVQSRATNKGSTLHGPQHWRCVSLVGVRLSRLTPGADPLVAFLFGLFHDSRRVNDGDDPEHGRRGARLLRDMAAGGEVAVTPEVLERVAFACETHTEAGTTSDPVIGVLYDADRLNLWRESITPLPRYLSTAAGKDMIEACRELHWTPLTWARVLDELFDVLA